MLERRSVELMVQGRNLPWLLQQWVRRTPDNRFLIWAPPNGAHRTWSYAEFQVDVDKVASNLAALGLRRGQFLLIHLENCPEFLITYFACAQIGVIAVMTNTQAVAREMTHYCRISGVTAAVTQPKFLPLLNEAAPDLGFVAVTEDNAGEPCNVAEVCFHDPRTILYQNLLVPCPFAPQSAGACAVHDQVPPEQMPLNGEERDVPDAFEDLRVQFTSGTTSLPKAVLSTHANALFAGQQTAYAYGLTGRDIAMVLVPLFHNNGLSTLVTSTLWAGGTVVLQRKFSVSTFWDVALKYQATWTSLPGSFFLNALMKERVPEHNFRFWIAGASPAIQSHFGVQTRWHWGMTEMIALPIVGDPYHNGPSGCIGRPIPGLEVAIRRDDGSDCGPGEIGALYVRGVRGITLFKEYLNDAQATEAGFDEQGWFDTGDRIRLDHEGNLYFADRGKDMLRVGGENVAASEIEAIIHQSGWIKECAVVGKKHDMLDEVPVAFVIPQEDAPQPLEEKLIDHCRQSLADFKVIRNVYVVEDFPRSTLQKIAKQKLRENLAEMLQ